MRLGRRLYPGGLFLNLLLTHFTSYYFIKNASVAGDANAAVANFQSLVQIAESINYKIISKDNINTLVKDAGSISTTKDIRKQREYFANFSSNMALIAKTVKLTEQPIDHPYCPMQKTYWRSSEKVIKNTYFGSAMPSCGQAKEIL